MNKGEAKIGTLSYVLETKNLYKNKNAHYYVDMGAILV